MTGPDGDRHVRAKPARRLSPPEPSAERSGAAADDQHGAAAGGDSDARLWWITFSASLASIVGGAAVLGISFALVRGFRHLSPGGRQWIETIVGAALLGIGSLIWLRRGKLLDLLLYRRGWVLATLMLVFYIVPALAGILMIIGYLAGVK